MRRRRWSWWHRAEPWRGAAGGNIRCRRFQEGRSRDRRHSYTQCSSTQTDTHTVRIQVETAPPTIVLLGIPSSLLGLSSFAKYPFAHWTHLLITATSWTNNNKPKMFWEWCDGSSSWRPTCLFKTEPKVAETSKFSWLIEWENSRLIGQEDVEVVRGGERTLLKLQLTSVQFI